MPSTKVTTAIHSGTSLGAGSGDTTSSVITIDDGYGGKLWIKHTNGATAPTIPAQTVIEESGDNTEFYAVATVYGTTINSDIVSHPHKVGIGVEYIRLVSGSNTGQAVTIDADICEVTAT